MVDIKIGVKVDGSFLYFSARCGTIDQLKLAITRQFPMIDDTRLIFYYEGNSTAYQRCDTNLNFDL